MLKKKISNPAQAHAGKVLLINSFDDICFFRIYNDSTLSDADINPYGSDMRVAPF